MAHPTGRPRGEADRRRWNTRFAGRAPTFAVHPLTTAALEADVPDGPVLELACGRSGSALALAELGRRVVVADVSDVALDQLRGEARRRGVHDRVLRVEVDLCAWASAVASGRKDVRGTEFPELEGPFAFVLATLFWDADVFRAACARVAPGGLLGWEALADARPRRYHVRHGQLEESLPPGWRVVRAELVGAGARRSSRLLARRTG
ncbi:hypothetical protein [Saccharomonospora saliphila]|uniref:hypothetical protein n=1 Tax=Saccharomonospora saliphila TaxID=369829 RepID=UPI00039B900E|nr:hypothetical protein [Saccharomonospora saliphila]